jgi:tetratricopeptide (TPR) repeat protein
MNHGSRIALSHDAAQIARSLVFALTTLYLVLSVSVPVAAGTPGIPHKMYDGALARVTATSPAAAWERVRQARTAGSENRHDVSVKWYLEAVALHPPLRLTLAREIGYQYTRANNPESALAWYETYLAFCPGDVESHLGIARALSRSRRVDEALTHYRTVLPLCENLPLDVRLEIDKLTVWKSGL